MLGKRKADIRVDVLFSALLFIVTYRDLRLKASS
jgi:hypothetical protein